MKSYLFILTAVFLLGVIIPSSQARSAVSVDFFYDNLEAHGDWREVDHYGYCWQPHDISPDWRPYSDGRWVYTDAGWTWDSNEAYGWAVYHYGRWVNISRIGWLWVPGTEWGPGWVSWRHNAQYTGWAPLPPEARLLLHIGLSSWVDDYYDIGPSHYRFVENRNFGASRINNVFVDQRQNISIIHQTTNITNISYVNNVVYNGGPVYDQQLRQSHEPIRRYKLDRRQEYDGSSRRQPPENLHSRIDGDSMSVLALPFTGRTATAPRQLGERIERAEVNHGWRNTGTPDEVAALRKQMKSREKVPERLPAPTAFVKVTDASAVREERGPDEGPLMPDERPARPKAESGGMRPALPGEQNTPGRRPPSSKGDGRGDDKPGRPDMRPSGTDKPARPDKAPPPSAETPKGRDTNKPMRPDMPPGFPKRLFRPGETPPLDLPKSEKPGRPDQPPPPDRKPGRGEIKKTEAPPVPAIDNGQPPIIMPKGSDHKNMPKVPRPKQLPAPVPPEPSR